MRPIVRRWPWLALLAVVELMTPVAGAQSVLKKSYPISPIGTSRSATFISQVTCGFGCTITHEISSPNVDRYVVVKWLDAGGSPLMDQVDNSYWSNFFDPAELGGSLSATQSQSKGIATYKTAMGTADFTGTGAGSDPCGVGYVCSPPNGPEYYYFPPLFPAPTSGGGNPGNAPTRLAAPAASYDAITTTLSGVLLNPDLTLAQDAKGNDLRASVLTFTSEVEQINGKFHYVYTVFNATDLAVPVTWADAGIDAAVPASGSFQNELITSLAPGTQNSATSYLLNRQYSGGAVIYAPVPEPKTWLMLAAGLLVVSTARLRARTTSRPHQLQRSERDI